MTNPFRTRQPSIQDNQRIRAPQREAYVALESYAANHDNVDREIGIVLPVGCGKSGCITIAPFAFQASRTLVVAPSVAIAKQLHDDFNPTRTDMFYVKCQILAGQPYPEPVEIRGTTTNRADLDDAHVVITNIQQLQGGGNRWLQSLPNNYFDLILFDEGHHSVAESWTTLKAKFPEARIVNFSATPLRADGEVMAGKIIYSYPIFRAIQEGYVKRLKAVVLNPRTLRYVRREDSIEIEVSLDEVKRLGEADADFRRSIVTSKETLATIVDASIGELDQLRIATGEKRLKLIASALNYEHCRQIVEAYRSRGRRADYVHSREDSAANNRVMTQLENHELDVIVQVRKLGEGFDHPYLAVAAVFSVFSNLSPFVQFVGRIMRVIEQNAPQSLLNSGVVVFHSGSNIARQWSDFQTYSEADRDFFDQLLPMEGLDFSSSDELTVEPIQRDAVAQSGETIEIRAQTDVRLQEISLIRDNPEALAALRVLQSHGYSADEVQEAYKKLEPIPTTKVAERQAMRNSLDMRIRNEAGRILSQKSIMTEGHELDRQRLGRSNFIVVKAALDRQVNAIVGCSTGERSELSRDQLDLIEREFDNAVTRACQEVFDVN